jgi:hypothetical protein
MPCQLQQSRVEMDQTAVALQHRRFEIVIQKDSGTSGKRPKSVHVPTQEVLHRLIEEKLQIQRPRPRQGHHEAAQRAPRAAHHDRTKRRPVNLRLLTAETLQAQKASCGRGRNRATTRRTCWMLPR